MLQSYLTVILRNLRKHKGFAFINVTGLAVGLACCLLIFLFVRLEQGYDRFHDNADRIYRIATEVRPPSGQVTNVAFSSPALAPALVEDLTDVEQAVRLIGRDGVVRHDSEMEQETLLFVDSTFFDVFSFPLLRGDAATALARPNSVVLTPEAAARYFGNADPMDQTITFADSISLTVTGLIAPAPPNSHINFDILASASTLALSRSTQWGRLGIWTYALVTPGTTTEDFAAQLPAFARNRMGDGLADIMVLHPQRLTDIYFDSNLIAEIGPTGDRTYVYVFSIIGLFVLLVACINFMNLATARSFHRAREVGVRKVLGAVRRQLIGQFLGESMLLVSVALVLGFGLAALAFPVFRDLTGMDLTIHALFAPPLVGLAVGATLIVGLLAGGYPALFLSAFKPTAVLKGRVQTTPAGSLVRKGLIVVQFTISIALLIGTAFVIQQLHFMRTKSLGFNQEQVVMLRLDNEQQQRAEVLKNAFLQSPEVQAATAASVLPGFPVAPRPYIPDGLDEGVLLINTTRIDYDYLPALELDLLAGRNFATDRATDTGGFLINGAAVEEFGWASAEDALGKEIAEPTDGEPETWPRGPVVGVLEDYHYASLHEPIQPLILRLGTSFSTLALRVQTSSLSETMDRLEAQWQTLAPDTPFAAGFLDERLQYLYETEQRLGQLFGYFAALAVFIACLGLFGLAAFTAERRTKEIGVRKVLGATVPRIAGLLTKEYLVLMAVANVLAWPLAYLAMQRWLDSFSYRIDLAWWVFVAAGLVALTVALLSVSYQSLKAALTDPVKALRYE